ncbi:DEAD/DEAH box helicase [Maribellus sp. CM-23]|uniref:DEAD/DEAH box helicase n=1 Tax=Maribellus sp. CM-23 TaxID=2781026 RepID=UPI001F1E24FE|nr:DEAD/DEAH box helicase [Maribellus sp. CM-23]MCE4566452.1 DEAD/DEAH box helicase [Maribellus sp. CM-23]
MGELEFIIALTEHRFVGMVFQPFLIRRLEKFYTVVRLVKPHDFEDSEYEWRPYEKELVKTIEKYSDERLMKRFSRAESVSEFFSRLDSGVFQRQVLPFIEQRMMDVASVLMLSPVRLFKKEAKYSNLYDEDVIHVPPVFARPEFYFERTELQTRYRLKVFMEGKELLLSKRTNRIITNEPCLMLYRDQLIAFEKLNAKRLMPFFEKDVVSVPNTIEEKYYSGFILNTVRDFDVKASGFEIREADINKKAVLSLEVDLQYRPAFVLRFTYGQENFLPGSAKQTSVSLQKKGSSYVFLKTVRDFEWEGGVIKLLEQKGLAEFNGYYQLKGAEVLEQQNALYHLLNWLGEQHDELKKYGIEAVQKQGDKKYFAGSGHLELKTQTRGDWFDVYAVVRFGEFSIPFIRLKKYILNDIHEFALPNGEIAILPDEWFARYKGLLPYGKDKGERIEFHKHHFTLLQQSFEGIDSDVKEKFLKLKDVEKEETVLPSKLKASLRTYQEEGFNWMYGLYKNGLGGCLADDMGLGKTLQTLTLLLKLKRSQQPIKTGETDKNGQLDMFGGSAPDETVQVASLIVLPTSLVHNWSNEIAKFTPSLKVYKYVGLQRKKVEDIGKIARFYDIILTTYGTMRNDSEMLAATEFFYLILDESQSIKNSGSKTYKALMKIKARHKLVITGTPIENSLSDLWSQMNFLNPGLLGSLAFFQRMFITPIEKHANEEQMEKLQLMIRPFVLRRKKMEVARDLPPLMEEVRICSMADDQQKLYDKEKSIIRNTILSAIEKEGMNKSQFVVLQGLTRLRQLANHPSLLEKDAGESSGKFDEIFRMLQNLVAEKHKVLIFSSFVTHLELLESKIKKQRWKYSKLTGQTTKREEVIKEFQENDENRIFLISLKAGGVGLNLTEADYVFIIDPWWNPAAEIQAINRAHRIGQDKHVFVYRFITENSIEEKIQKLKERKSSLADKFINSNDPFQQITKEEIVELFK